MPLLLFQEKTTLGRVKVCCSLKGSIKNICKNFSCSSLLLCFEVRSTHIVVLVILLNLTSFYCSGKNVLYRYSHYLNCVVLRPPDPLILLSDGLSLCDLPPIMLIKIFQYLDSASLRCLSSACKHLRLMCFEMASDSAMVNIKWERTESGNWSGKCFVSYFELETRQAPCVLLIYREFIYLFL